MKKKSYRVALVLIGTVLAACMFASCEKSAKAPTQINLTQTAPTPAVLASANSFSYQEFDDASFEDLKGKEKFAVFVHSRSCGTCAKKNKQIIDDVSQYTDGKILKLEFDKASTDFLEAYGVTKYDTFVVFDEQ